MLKVTSEWWKLTSKNLAEKNITKRDTKFFPTNSNPPLMYESNEYPLWQIRKKYKILFYLATLINYKFRFLEGRKKPRVTFRRKNNEKAFQVRTKIQFLINYGTKSKKVETKIIWLLS